MTGKVVPFVRPERPGREPTPVDDAEPMLTLVGKAGDIEVMVDIWPDETGSLRMRNFGDTTWGPPVDLEEPE